MNKTRLFISLKETMTSALKSMARIPLFLDIITQVNMLKALENQSGNMGAFLTSNQDLFTKLHLRTKGFLSVSRRY